MRILYFRVSLFSLCLLAVTLLVKAQPWTAPPELALPLGLAPSDEGGWKRTGDRWTLEAGTDGVLETSAWWEGNRPSREQAIVLEIEYLDNVSKPVVAEIYSGLGTTDPYSELHRFGGSADGTWKTARIPATGDFIFRYLPNQSIRFRLRAPAANLEVRDAALVAPRADEKALYNATSREWVRRSQERATVSDRFFALAQKPVLSAQWSGRPLVPYHRNWMDLVRPISAPQQGEVTTIPTVEVFLNEVEPIQLGVYANGTDLRNVRVAVDPVVSPSGRRVADISVRVAEYAKVRGQLIPGFLIELFPQRLWPAHPFDVASGQSHMVWLNLRTEEGSAVPGTYRTVVRFRANGVTEVEMPLRLVVHDARLLTMDEAGLKLGGCTTGLLPEFELEFLREYNHNMINLWYAGVRPELSGENGVLEMDFRIMDEWMSAAARQGINDVVYFLGGNPYGFPRTMNLPRTLAETVLGMDGEAWRRLSFEDPSNVPPEVTDLMVEWTRRFSGHARAHGWPNIILTPFDEPAKYVQYYSGLGMLNYIKPQFKQQVRLLRTGDPKAEIYGSIHHYDSGIDFLEDVDVFCTNAVHENAALPDEVRAAGKTLWEYSGTTDRGLPAVARYTFGFYFAAHDSRGSLVWAYNWGNRFDTLDGSNWMYAWNTPFEVIPTPYFEGMREAWDDRRLLETLRKVAAARGHDLVPFLGRLFAEVAAARGRGGTDTVSDFWERAKEDQIMDEWRQRMRDLLLRLSAD